MGVSLSRRRDGGGGITGGGDLRPLPTEHNCTDHCKQANYGTVSVSGMEDGVKVGQAVVGSGHIGLRGDADSRLLDKINIRGEEIDGTEL